VLDGCLKCLNIPVGKIAKKKTVWRSTFC